MFLMSFWIAESSIDGEQLFFLNSIYITVEAIFFSFVILKITSVTNLVLSNCLVYSLMPATIFLCVTSKSSGHEIAITTHSASILQHPKNTPFNSREKTTDIHHLTFREKKPHAYPPPLPSKKHSLNLATTKSKGVLSQVIWVLSLVIWRKEHMSRVNAA